MVCKISKQAKKRAFRAVLLTEEKKAELPIIKSDLVTIIECIDEISAVEPDTWLLSLNYNEVIQVYHEGKITVGTVSAVSAKGLNFNEHNK